jgi:hypothetical protein
LLLGGYTSLSFNSSESWKPDPNAFLFSLTNPKNFAPFQCPLLELYQGSDNIFFDSIDFLPVWSDLRLDNDTLQYSLDPKIFNYPEGLSALLAGSTGFKVDEIEVFALEPLPQSSSIANEQHLQQVATWANVSLATYSSCYRSFEHGASMHEFHARCDNRGSTITFVKSVNGNIFGAYTSIPYQSFVPGTAGMYGFVEDPKSFIFSLTNVRGVPVKFSEKKNQKNVYFNKYFGPTFGDFPFDFQLMNYFDTSLVSSSLGNSYTEENPYPTSALLFANNTNIPLNEMEVFVSTGNSPSLNSSVIVTQQMIAHIENWTNRTADKWFLCFRASKDGFIPAAFHTLCNGLGPSVTIFRSTDGYIFGGYTSISWASNGAVSDPNAFLFTLLNPFAFSPQKTTLLSPKGNVLDDPNSLPVFGKNRDFDTKGNSVSTEAMMSPGRNYEFSEVDPACLFGGSSQFRIAEVEVFVEDSVPLPTSNLLTPDFEQTLKAWTGATNISLCFQSSIYGSSSVIARSRCADKGAIALVARSQSNHVFGVYSSRYMSMANTWTADDQAFLFSFNNSLAIPNVKFPSKSNINFGMLQDMDWVAAMGDKEEFRLLSEGTYVTVPILPYFESPIPIYSLDIFFAGTPNIMLSDIEVYTVAPGSALLAESTIITPFERSKLEEWSGIANWALCFKASVDGWSPSTFHANCDNKGPSIAIYQSVDGFIFGGYASTPWSSLNQSVYDSNAFLFSLRNYYGHEPVRSSPLEYPYSALLDNWSNFPSFGYDELNCTGNIAVVNQLGSSIYNFREYNAKTFLTGTHNFYIDYWELFVVSTPIVNETIITESQKATIQSWIGSANHAWELCWKGSANSFDASMFHLQCDHKGPSVSVVQTPDDYIFGGYLSISWRNSTEAVVDSSAFLFSLNNSFGNVPTKFPVNILNYQQANMSRNWIAPGRAAPAACLCRPPHAHDARQPSRWPGPDRAAPRCLHLPPSVPLFSCLQSLASLAKQI